MSEPRKYKHIVSKDGTDSMLIDPAFDAYTTLAPMCEYVRYEDYMALKKKYDDLEYCRGYVPFKEHNTYATKMTELYYGVVGKQEEAVKEIIRLRKENQELERRFQAAANAFSLAIQLPDEKP